VAGCKTTAELWSTLQGVFQRKNLMNEMKARREFYTVEMTVGEGMLGYINRVRNLGVNLKAMGGEVTEMDVAMSVLNGLTSKYENLLVALDAKGEDELSLDFVKSRLLREERRQADKSPSTKFIGDMALVGANYRGPCRRGDLSKIECSIAISLITSVTIAQSSRPRSKDRTRWPRWRITMVATATTPSVWWAMRLTPMTSPSRGLSILQRLHTCAGCAGASTTTGRPRDAASSWVTRGP